MAIAFSPSTTPLQQVQKPPHPKITINGDSMRLFLNPSVTWTKSLSRKTNIMVSAISSRGIGGESTSLKSEETDTDLLDGVQVFDLDGNGIPISDLWKDRKAVVAFARHFGCVLCRKRADYIAAKKAGLKIMQLYMEGYRQDWKLSFEKDTVSKGGWNAVLIARTFSEQTKFKGEVYADPSHLSYKALKFVSGVTTTFTPQAGLKIMQLYMEGYRQDWKLSFEKDTVSKGGWQQGGVIVAGPGKTNFSYIHRDREAGDDPDIEDILKACCS